MLGDHSDLLLRGHSPRCLWSGGNHIRLKITWVFSMQNMHSSPLPNVSFLLFAFYFLYNRGCLRVTGGPQDHGLQYWGTRHEMSKTELAALSMHGGSHFMPLRSQFSFWNSHVLTFNNDLWALSLIFMCKWLLTFLSDYLSRKSSISKISRCKPKCLVLPSLQLL